MLIRTEGISHFFGYQDIFFDVDLNIYKKDKIALIGKNGSGKTTLLNILSDDLEPMEGKVFKSNSLKIEFLKQFRIENPNESIYDFVKKGINSTVEEILIDKKIKSVLIGLGFEDNCWSRNIGSLSGGELTRLSLGRTIAGEHNLLLLDEPTNHLDLYSINWLQNYLNSYQGAVIIVSHDRNFLDKVCNKYWEINNYMLWEFKGDYSTYISQREIFINTTEAKKNNLEKEIKRIDEMAKRYRSYGTEKMVKQAIIRERTLEKLKKEYESINNIEDDKAITFKLPEPRRTGLKVIETKNLKFSYKDDNKTILNNINFDLSEGEKLAILGKNGCGKTTLLNLLIGKNKPDKGIINWGYNIKIAYIDQVISSFKKDNDILQEIWTMMPNEPDYVPRKYIGRFGFAGDDVFKKINELSGGELTRLAISKLILKKPNVLILDEPTNHLDILTVEVLEKTLKEFKGAIILVSHDIKLLENVASKYLFINNGRCSLSENIDKFLPIILKDSFKIKKTKKTKNYYEIEKKRKNKLQILERNLNEIRKEAEKYFKRLDDIENDMIIYSSDYSKLNDIMKEKSEIEKKLLDAELKEQELLEELETCKENSEIIN